MSKGKSQREKAAMSYQSTFIAPGEEVHWTDKGVWGRTLPTTITPPVFHSMYLSLD